MSTASISACNTVLATELCTKSVLVTASINTKLFTGMGLMASLLLLNSLFAEQLNPVLAFDREAIAQGQWWRLISGHFVHNTTTHMLMNLAGLLFCFAYFFQQWSMPRLFGWLGLSITVVSTGLMIDGELNRYLGLSGILYGLLTAGLLLSWRQHPWLHSLLLAGLILRTVLEQLPGYDVHYLNTVIGLPVAVNAHAYGVASGLLFSLVARASRQ